MQPSKSARIPLAINGPLKAYSAKDAAEKLTAKAEQTRTAPQVGSKAASAYTAGTPSSKATRNGSK